MTNSKKVVQKSSTTTGDNVVDFKTMASLKKSISAKQKTADGFGMTNESSITFPPGDYFIGDVYHAMRLEIHEFDEMTRMGADYRSMYFPDEAKPDGKSCWYQFPETGDGCYKVLANTIPNAHVSGGGFFRIQGVLGILPFDLTCDSAADYASGLTVTFSKAVTLTYENGQLRFKSGKGELVIESVPSEYIALGVDLSHLTPDEQAERRLYLTGQVGRFAHGYPGGFVGPAYMMDGFYQLTVHSNEDPYKVFPDLLSRVDSGEIDIPEDNPEALVFKYALISFIDFEDPVYCLKEMRGDFRHFDMTGKVPSSPEESTASRLLRDAELFEERAKEDAGNLDISTPRCGRIGQNGYIYDQCNVTLARIMAKRLKMIANRAKKADRNCSRRLNIDPPCRLNIDPGPVAVF